MNNENQDMLRLWLIFAMLLFPTEQNGELKMTQNEENNLNMLMKEIGEINKLKERTDGNDV